MIGKSDDTGELFNARKIVKNKICVSPCKSSVVLDDELSNALSSKPTVLFP